MPAALGSPKEAGLDADGTFLRLIFSNFRDAMNYRNTSSRATPQDSDLDLSDAHGRLLGNGNLWYHEKNHLKNSKQSGTLCTHHFTHLECVDVAFHRNDER